MDSSEDLDLQKVQMLKEKEAERKRLSIARIWIFIVLSYYFLVASYNVFPDFN